MAVENKMSEAAQMEVDAVAETHRFIGQSWMGWVALYAILMLLDQIAS